MLMLISSLLTVFPQVSLSPPLQLMPPLPSHPPLNVLEENEEDTTSNNVHIIITFTIQD